MSEVAKYRERLYAEMQRAQETYMVAQKKENPGVTIKPLKQRVKTTQDMQTVEPNPVQYAEVPHPLHK
jgi:hypothetical protein